MMVWAMRPISSFLEAKSFIFDSSNVNATQKHFLRAKQRSQSTVSNNRLQELRKIKLQMEDLKADLGSKDNKLKIMREEMASVIDLARHKQSTLSSTSTSDPTSLHAAKPKPSVQVSKPKKKPQSRKWASSPRSSESSPE